MGIGGTSIRPLVARDSAIWARLDTLLFRYQEPGDDWTWGVDSERGFMFDWWALGGRWHGWGRDVRDLMTRQRVRPSPRPVPRFLAHNAVWSKDLGRVRLTSPLLPVAVVTPHGDWREGSSVLPSFGRMTIRQRKAKAAWLRRVRRLMHAYPECLAIAVDYHC